VGQDGFGDYQPYLRGSGASHYGAAIGMIEKEISFQVEKSILTEVD